jgi:hypothetical protein
MNINPGIKSSWSHIESKKWQAQERNQSLDSQEGDVPAALVYGRRQDGEHS